MLSDVEYTLHRSSIEDGQVAVSTADAKRWLRLLGDEEDDLVETAIYRSAVSAENAFERAVLLGTWVLSYKSRIPPKAAILLPRPPFVELLAVETWDSTEDEWTALAADEYVVAETEPLARVIPTEHWPLAPIRFRYKAGYPTLQAPGDIKSAILELTAWNFEHRGDEPSMPGVGGSTGAPPKIRSRYPHLVVYA